jgi:glycosyltransferase WbpL
MGSVTAVIGFFAGVAAALLTGLVRKQALARGVLDIPNPRSSHTRATPRGGGIAIVTAATLALLVLALRGGVPRDLLLALTVGGLAVAGVGLADDRKRMPAGVRFAVHITAAVWAVVCLGGLAPLRVGAAEVAFGWSGYLLATLGVVWVLNLFNFMDGIDGIAASEATFVAWAGALLAIGSTSGAAVILGAACLGFLCWNWPPARIFMGDVGSGYIGYALSVLALAAARNNPAAVWVWLILGGVFFVDATVTLARRMARGERLHEAHRIHAYQWLARRWNSHLRVTVVVLLVNILWLLPCADFAARHPRYAALTAVIALAPLAVLALLAGAGRGEVPARAQP